MLNKTVYVTEHGREALEVELEQLRNVERPQLIEQLQDAQDGGDWMDNAEQLIVQDELAFVDGRIRELEEILATAEIIHPDASDGIVGLGDTAVILAEGETETEQYTIVGTAEADPGQGLISNESPLGQALLNHKVGDEVIVVSPGGQSCYRVVAIK